MVVASVVLAAGVAGLVWTWRTRPQQRRAALAVAAAAGLGFQVVHALEHLVQGGAWFAAPGRPPFLTPWAAAGRDALAVVGSTTAGEELLHLGGNLVFLAGVVALAALSAQSGVARSRSLRRALAIQSVHVVEHVALTATSMTVGRAIGVTSVFGLLDPGPMLWTLRPAAHLALNLVATVFAVLAVRSWARSRDGNSMAAKVRTLGPPASQGGRA